MKKKLLLLLSVVCCLTLTIGLLAACGDNGDNGGNGGGTGDSIFTEGASLEDIASALENAKNITVTVTDDENYITSRIIDTAYELIRGQKDTSDYIMEYVYRSNGMDYYISKMSDLSGSIEYNAEKDIEQTDPTLYSDYMNDVCDLLILFTTDDKGNIVLNTSALDRDESDYIEGSAYVKLLGDSIEFGFDLEYTYSEGEVSHIMVTLSGINATTVEIPADIKAQEAKAEWSKYVNYNGYTYCKYVDSDGNEYYAFYGTPPEGAVLAETINNLPVK